MRQRPVEVAHAGISTARGNYGEAALSVAAMVPLAGSGATATKLATKYGDEVVGAAGKVADAVCSFTPDTPVATADGPVPIGDLAEGDLVLAYHEATRTTVGYTVTAVLVHTDLVIVDVTIAGERITTTPEHPFFVLLRGWVPASELHIGDWVRSADGSYGSVQVLTSERRPQLMYNLTVATAHTFFVGQGRWLVHNQCVTALANTAHDAHRRLPDPLKPSTVGASMGDDGKPMTIIPRLSSCTLFTMNPLMSIYHHRISILSIRSQ